MASKIYSGYSVSIFYRIHSKHAPRGVGPRVTDFLVQRRTQFINFPTPIPVPVITDVLYYRFNALYYQKRKEINNKHNKEKRREEER